MKSALLDVLSRFAEDGDKGALRVVVYGDKGDKSELKSIYSYNTKKLGGGNDVH